MLCVDASGDGASADIHAVVAGVAGDGATDLAAGDRDRVVSGAATDGAFDGSAPDGDGVRSAAAANVARDGSAQDGDGVRRASADNVARYRAATDIDRVARAGAGCEQDVASDDTCLLLDGIGATGAREVDRRAAGAGDRAGVRDRDRRQGDHPGRTSDRARIRQASCPAGVGGEHDSCIGAVDRRTASDAQDHARAGDAGVVSGVDADAVRSGHCSGDGYREVAAATVRGRDAIGSAADVFRHDRKARRLYAGKGGDARAAVPGHRPGRID